jgi:hypothetical protein
MPNRYYSLTKVVYFFIFFFFGIIPLNDELKNNVYWNFRPLNVYAYQDVNFILLLGLLFFSLGNMVTIKNFNYFDNLGIRNFKFNFKFYFLSFITLTIFSYLILKDSDFNILRLLTRDTPLELLNEDYTSQYNSISTSIFFDTFINDFTGIIENNNCLELILEDKTYTGGDKEFEEILKLFPNHSFKKIESKMYSNYKGYLSTESNYFTLKYEGFWLSKFDCVNITLQGNKEEFELIKNKYNLK